MCGQNKRKLSFFRIPYSARLQINSKIKLSKLITKMKLETIADVPIEVLQACYVNDENIYKVKVL